MDALKTKSHLKSLQAKKEKIDQTILEEEKRPMPDIVRIHELKRQKLKLNDEIAIFEKAS